MAPFTGCLLMKKAAPMQADQNIERLIQSAEP
jgi:hypothetical protein